jgi:hypothetical protein
MRARKLGCRVVGALCAVVSMLALWSASASALLTHEYVSSFGSFSGSLGVAVEQFSGDVYVVDSGGNQVEKFDGAGNPVAGWSLGAMTGPSAGGLSSPYGAAVDQTTGDLYVADFNNGTVDKFDSSRGFLLSFTGAATPAGSFSPAGLATDSLGDVYVADYAHGVVDKFDSSGTYLASFGEGVLSSTNGVAVDGSGDIYATANSSQLVELDPSGACINACTPIDTGSVGVGIDPATGHVYSADGGYVAEYDSAGKPIDRFGSGHLSGAYGVAIDGASGDVYTSDRYSSTADIFGALVTVPDVTTGAASTVTASTTTLRGTVNPEEAQVTSCLFEYGTDLSYGHTVSCASNPGAGSGPVEVTANITGLEPNTTYHYRLAASNANGTSHGQDQTLLTLSPPIVGREWSLEVGISTASINAIVNPKGYETTYHFEYGTSTAYGTSVPVPDLDIGSGGGEVSVSEPLTGLMAGTTYHYRLVAVNANGTTNGQDTTFTTGPAPTTAQTDACPNAANRAGGLSANLPDCRAYEMVSPLDKNGGDVDGDGNTVLAAVSGARVAYASRVGFGDTRGTGGLGIDQYLATRGANSWSTHGITPTPQVKASQLFAGDTFVMGFSEGLDQGLVEGTALPGATGGVPNDPNLYREDTVDNQLEAITTPLGTEEAINPFKLLNTLRGYSNDLQVVTFETKANLLPQTTGRNSKLYVWDHGTLKLAGLLPGDVIPENGSASPEAMHEAPERNDTVSRDGTRIAFVSTPDGESSPQLYLRRNATNTAWVSQSEATAPNPEPQNVTFESASPDLTKIVFASTDRLSDSDPGGGGYGLYLYTDSPTPESESNLTFIARVSGANVFGGNSGFDTIVPAISDDGSHVYFYSEEMADLPPAGGSGRDLYLWDSGTLRFIAPSVGGDLAEASTDGRRLALLATYYETPQSERGPAAMYIYDESSQTLHCASCPSSGVAPTSNVVTEPLATGAAASIGMPFHHRFLSSNGHYLFFSTADALVPQDTNGLYDVYEYDTDTGKIGLLSSGAGENGSWFVDANPSGHDVFFVTRQSLSGWDTDKLVDLYDARVDGGLPEPPPNPVPCDGDACQGIPSAVPTFNTASGFSGLGNLIPFVSTGAKTKAKISKSTTRLAHALKACKRKPRTKRRACEIQSRKRYKANGSTMRASRAGR